MATITSDRRVLEQIGRDALLAKFSEPNVKQWHYRGIPWPHRQAVQDLAEQSGIETPPNFLTAKPPLPKAMGKAKKRKRAKAA